MNKKTWLKKIIFIIFIICIILSTTSNYVQAFDNIMSGSNRFEGAYKNIPSNSASGQMGVNEANLQEVSNTVYNTLQLVGIIAAVIIGMVLGIKYMSGSIEQKAEVKQTLIPYVIGCIIVFGAFSIWKIVLGLLNQM